MSVHKLSDKGDDLPIYRYEPVFMLGRAMYVPHYVKKHEWVSYGGTTKSTIELMSVGAKPHMEYLWQRSWTEQEIFKKHKRDCTPTELKNLILNQNISVAPTRKSRAKVQKEPE
jgi:hypothetical protein